jgi:glycosyltransferase involved in cell wall biosynthesis
MGCGLPVIVSPMGSGPARDGIDGFVRDSHDIDGWVTALRRLAEDADLRGQMSQAARERANLFTWKKVGTRRRETLLSAINSGFPEEVTV